MEPTTIPAIWPPLRPGRAAEVDGLAGDDAPGAAVICDVIVIGCRADEATIGRLTFLQIDVAFEKTQHESVALGELAAQYPHRPPVLPVKPQLSG